jgi:hypothetical protein
MGLGEVLDKTFAIYRSRFLLFAGLAALPQAVMLGIHCADLAWWHVQSLVQPYRQPGIFLWNLAISLGYYHIAGFLGILVFPAFVQACSSLLFGESTSILAALRFTAARCGTYLWIAVLKLCLVLVVPEAVSVCGLLASAFLLDKMGLLNGSGSIAAGVVALLLILGAFALFLWVGACFAYAIPVAALEGPPGLNALRRSWALSRKGRWRVAVAWVLVCLCAFVVDLTIAFLVRWITGLLHGGNPYVALNHPAHLSTLYFVYSIIAAVVAPLYPIAVTLLYYDQRVRKEGYDLEKMMEMTRSTAPEAAGNAGISSC